MAHSGRFHILRVGLLFLPMVCMVGVSHMNDGGNKTDVFGLLPGVIPSSTQENTAALSYRKVSVCNVCPGLTGSRVGAARRGVASWPMFGKTDASSMSPNGGARKWGMEPVGGFLRL